jgi:hypothetical protein
MIDLVDEALTAGVERRRIERRIAVDAVEAVLGEDGAERSGNRDATFGVDLVGVETNWSISPSRASKPTGLDWMNKRRFGAGARSSRKMGGGSGAESPRGL